MFLLFTLLSSPVLSCESREADDVDGESLSISAADAVFSDSPLTLSMSSRSFALFRFPKKTPHLFAIVKP